VTDISCIVNRELMKQSGEGAYGEGLPGKPHLYQS
jgi:hypothetical protein